MQEKIFEEEVEMESLKMDLPEIDINAMSDRKFGEKIPKPNLDGKVVTIEKIELKMTQDEKKTREGKKIFVPVVFRVFYNTGSDIIYENYGGVSMFKKPDGKFSEPTLWADGKSAAAKLFRLWLSFRKKKANEVSLKDFFVDLKGRQVELKYSVVQFQGEDFGKNIVVKFVR